MHYFSSLWFTLIILIGDYDSINIQTQRQTVNLFPARVTFALKELKYSGFERLHVNTTYVYNSYINIRGSMQGETIVSTPKTNIYDQCILPLLMSWFICV